MYVPTGGSNSILIIDSNPLRAKMIKGWFGSDYNVACRTSVEAGEQYLLNFSPSLIISSEEISSDIPTIRLEQNSSEPDYKERLLNKAKELSLAYTKRLELEKECKKLREENEFLHNKVEIQSAYLKKAGDVQKSMLKTKQYPDKLRIATKFLPLLDLSGDFYYYKRYDDRFYFFIGDVVDHGAEAAIYMTELTSFLYALMQEEKPLSILLREFNRLGRYYNHCVLSATVFAGCLELTTGNLEYCSIGHELPYIVGNNGLRELAQGKTYLPVGFNETDEFEIFSDNLSYGEKLFLFTDGLTEEFNSVGVDAEHEYGEKHLIPVLLKNKDENADVLCENVLSDMQNFIAGNERNDDVLVLCIERTEENE